MTPRPIYLDHHATTPVDPAVVAAMLPYFTEKFGNASSRQHLLGQEAHAAVEEARAHVARLIGAEPGDIVFTSGATESNNLAVRGVAHAAGAQGRHLVVTAIEHPAVLEPARHLQTEGFEVTVVAAGSDGIVAADEVVRALRPDTALVSVMAANNEIGTLQAGRGDRTGLPRARDPLPHRCRTGHRQGAVSCRGIGNGSREHFGTQDVRAERSGRTLRPPRAPPADSPSGRRPKAAGKRKGCARAR